MPHDLTNWEEKLMDKFCVMFERATRENDETDWVENLENFIRSLLEQAKLEGANKQVSERIIELNDAWLEDMAKWRARHFEEAKQEVLKFSAKIPKAVLSELLTTLDQLGE